MNKYIVIYDLDSNDGFITFGIEEPFETRADALDRIAALERSADAFNIELYYPPEIN